MRGWNFTKKNDGEEKKVVAQQLNVRDFIKKETKNYATECKNLIQTHTHTFAHREYKNNLFYRFDIVYVQPHKQDY